MSNPFDDIVLTKTPTSSNPFDALDVPVGKDTSNIRSAITGVKSLAKRGKDRFVEAKDKIVEMAGENAASDLYGDKKVGVSDFADTGIAAEALRPIADTAFDVLKTGFKALATDDRVQEVKDLAGSKPVQKVAEVVDKGLEYAIPDPGDRELAIQLSNYLPIPVIDDIFKSSGRVINGTLDDAFKGNIRTGVKNVVDTVTAGKDAVVAPVKNIGNKIVEKTVATQWKLPPAIKRDIRKNTGMSAEKFALDNDLVGSDIGESITRAENFKTNKINEKIQEVAKWGEVEKSPSQISMAESLRDNLEKSLSKDATGNITAGNDPELIKLLEGVKKFIESPKSTFDQVDALKSLYDHYNPDNLAWDVQGRLVNPTAHQNAAFRRAEVQKLIESEGDKRGFDVKKLNKEIQGSHDLVKGLSRREEVMANNNIISLGDTQIAILGTVLGGDLSGLGLLLAKKGLGAEGTTGFLARKLYNRSNDTTNNRTSLSGTVNPSRVDRLNPVNNVGSNDVLAGVKNKILVNPTRADSVLQALKTGKIDLKKAIDEVKKLSPEEIAKSPELIKLKKLDTDVSNLSKKTKRLGEVPTKELTVITDDIKNQVYTPEEVDYIMDNSPKEALPEIINANRELEGLEPIVEEVIESNPE